MIAVICAMKEELDALLEMMEKVSVSDRQTLFYHGVRLNHAYYSGIIDGKEVIATRSGVGTVYATISTVNLINDMHPDLIINLGVAGSLNKDIHVNDIVVANRVAHWRIDVPGWERSMNSIYCSFPCDSTVISIVKQMDINNVKSGAIVSGDEFIRFKKQTDIIKKNFPEALAGEMEGAAIANTCYAYGVPCSIIRSISDETLVNGNYMNFDFNLENACKIAAELCKEIIVRYGYEEMV
ncbi:MAG: 5'-methylthioadenosine/adenosylhomocysteine nucleosidase [Erysipelotrichaceae bacterium]|nr:5'-methylthioadenosine/adenosylhomocysteine nucleosidase [Erysipelotrichaceae bacterium]